MWALGSGQGLSTPSWPLCLRAAPLSPPPDPGPVPGSRHPRGPRRIPEQAWGPAPLPPAPGSPLPARGERAFHRSAAWCPRRFLWRRGHFRRRGPAPPSASAPRLSPATGGETAPLPVRIAPVPLSLCLLGGRLSLPELFKVAVAFFLRFPRGLSIPGRSGRMNEVASLLQRRELRLASNTPSLEMSARLPAARPVCVCTSVSSSLLLPVPAPAAPCSARCQRGVFIRQNLTAWDFQRAPERVVFVLPGSRDLRVRLSKQTFSIQSNTILCPFGKSVFISSSEGLRTSKGATSMPFPASLSWVWLKCQVK